MPPSCSAPRVATAATAAHPSLQQRASVSPRPVPAPSAPVGPPSLPALLPHPRRAAASRSPHHSLCNLPRHEVASSRAAARLCRREHRTYQGCRRVATRLRHRGHRTHQGCHRVAARLRRRHSLARRPHRWSRSRWSSRTRRCWSTTIQEAPGRAGTSFTSDAAGAAKEHGAHGGCREAMTRCAKLVEAIDNTRKTKRTRTEQT